MNQPVVYRVTPEQVGQEDVNDFLRTALSKQFADKNYSIVNEQSLDRYINGQKRKIKAYAIEVDSVTHSIYFDVTEVGVLNNTSWFNT
jgi:predicted transcriptional regulator